MQIAERMTRIGIESAFEVLQRARALEAQGKHVIHLEIGQPDFPTPAHIKDAAKRALDEGWTGYGPTPGFPDFRDAIAEYISRSRGIRVSGQNVVVVPGGKPIMFFAMMAVVEPGDEVIYPNPGFPIYESVINFLGATPVPIPRVLVRPRHPRRQAVAADEDDRPQLSGQPDRWRDPARGFAAHRRSHSRPRCADS
jgi:aspartate/methionine/tyrosine aminotransferase